MLRVVIRQKLEIQSPDAATSSIFPTVEAWLGESADRMNALKHMARRKDMERYRSVVDFLLCETLPIYRKSCMRFYRGKGPRLRDMITDRTLLVAIEAGMIQMVELCYEMHKRELETSWAAAAAATKKIDEYNETHETFSMMDFLEWASIPFRSCPA